MLKCTENAAQDVHLFPLQPDSAEEAAHALQQALGIGRVIEAAGGHCTLEMSMKALDVLESSEIGLHLRRYGRHQRSHAQLVAQHLHGRTQIERRELRVGRNAHRHRTQRDLVIGQSAGFGAEHQRYFTMLGMGNKLDRSLACMLNRHRTLPAPGGDRGRERYALQGLFQRTHHTRTGQQIPRPGCACVGYRIGKRERRDKHEATQPHRLHRARRRAYIARMTGADENDADTVKRDDAIHIKILCFVFTGEPTRTERLAIETQHMHPTLNIAVKAARRAATVINRASTQIDLLTVESKAPNDFVTEVDRAAEAAIIEVLRDAYPQHGILAEESGSTGGAEDSEYQWIIDPLDGTTNFLHGFPQYAVSIALARNGILEHAVVFDPTRNELFTASKGSGAFLNDRRIRVTRRTRLAESLIGTGFPFREFKHLDAYLAMFRELTQKTAGIRRPGAAALDLAYVASGRLDGFWEMGLQPWDMAAGVLLIQEAGGLVSDLSGESAFMQTGNVVAGAPKVFAQLLAAIQPHRPAAKQA